MKERQELVWKLNDAELELEFARWEGNHLGVGRLLVAVHKYKKEIKKLDKLEELGYKLQ